MDVNHRSNLLRESLELNQLAGLDKSSELNKSLELDNSLIEKTIEYAKGIVTQFAEREKLDPMALISIYGFNSENDIEVYWRSPKGQEIIAAMEHQAALNKAAVEANMLAAQNAAMREEAMFLAMMLKAEEDKMSDEKKKFKLSLPDIPSLTLAELEKEIPRLKLSIDVLKSSIAVLEDEIKEKTEVKKTVDNLSENIEEMLAVLPDTPSLDDVKNFSTETFSYTVASVTPGSTPNKDDILVSGSGLDLMLLMLKPKDNDVKGAQTLKVSEFLKLLKDHSKVLNERIDTINKTLLPVLKKELAGKESLLKDREKQYDKKVNKDEAPRNTLS